MSLKTLSYKKRLNMRDIKLDRDAMMSIIKVLALLTDDKFEYIGSLRFSDDLLVRRYVQRDSIGEFLGAVEFILSTQIKGEKYFKVRVLGKYAAAPSLEYTNIIY